MSRRSATAVDWDPTFLAELTIDSMAVDLEALLDALELERVAPPSWPRSRSAWHA